ncbi:hypothetical protein L9F63_015566, partial [Diploptera punctata]
TGPALAGLFRQAVQNKKSFMHELPSNSFVIRLNRKFPYRVFQDLVFFLKQ